MKIRLLLSITILFFSKIINSQTSPEQLLNREFLSNQYRVETIKSVAKLMCSTDAYYVKYYDKLNGNLRYIIKYDCNDKLTNLNYSCNAFSNEVITEFSYYQNGAKKTEIQYDIHLRIIGFIEIEKRKITFNVEEEKNKYPGTNAYFVKKVLFCDLKPFKTLIITNDGTLHYHSSRRPQNRPRKRYN